MISGEHIGRPASLPAVPLAGTSPSPTFFCVYYRLSMLGR